MKRFRVYADTSVYGGCFDEEFAQESQAFFESVRRGNQAVNLLNGYREIRIYSPKETVASEEE